MTIYALNTFINRINCINSNRSSKTADNKVSEAQRKANKKWDEKNKERKSYINKRSTAKSFILNLATQEDLETIKKYVEQRKNELNK